MSDSISQSSAEIPPPGKYWIGQELDWETPSVPVVLSVELPFWIMVPDCIQEVEVRGHRFNVEIKDGFIERYARMVRDSRSSCFYIGPPDLPKQPSSFKSPMRKLIEIFLPDSKKKTEGNVSVMDRKCKTVIRIHSACNKDVLAAANLENRRSHEACLGRKAGTNSWKLTGAL